MSKFTQILENYKTDKLKALSFITEEDTEDEFDKEVDIDKKKNAGKIRNKKIGAAAVQAVEIQKEDSDFTEEELLEYEIVKCADGKYRDDEGNVIDRMNKQQSDVSKRSMYGKPPKNYLKYRPTSVDLKKEECDCKGKSFKELFGKRKKKDDCKCESNEQDSKEGL